VNRKVIDSLIKAGAFDSMKGKRSQLIAVLDEALEHAKAVQRDRLSGQMNLFALAGEAENTEEKEIQFPEIEDWPQLKRLAYEKETVGFFLTGHPLEGVSEQIKLVAPANIASLENFHEGKAVRIAGLIQSYKEHKSKKGDLMAFTVFEDMSASVEVIVFPKTFAQCSELLQNDAPLVVLGSIQQGERGVKIIAETITPLDKAIENLTENTVIRLQARSTHHQHLVQLKDMLYQFHGSSPIKLTLHFDGRGEVDIEMLKDLTIRPCSDFFDQIKETFGEQSLFVKMKQPEIIRKKKGKFYTNKSSANN
jgi:DNA polymerase-3 subunit alpha